MFTGQRIGGKKAHKLIDKGNTILLDMRDAVAFRDGSIPGAINIPLRRISEVLKYPKTSNIIIFGEGYDDENVKAAINYVYQLGYINVFSLGDKFQWFNET